MLGPILELVAIAVKERWKGRREQQAHGGHRRAFDRVRPFIRGQYVARAKATPDERVHPDVIDAALEAVLEDQRGAQQR